MKIRIDKNDTLFSKIMRIKNPICCKCGKTENLNTCHIFSRGHYNTRFDEKNTVSMCFGCHQWFDAHKIFACLFYENKRCFDESEEAFHFLVLRCGYTWEALLELYRKSQIPYKGYKQKKDIIFESLTKTYESLQGEKK